MISPEIISNIKRPAHNTAVRLQGVEKNHLDILISVMSPFMM